MPTRPMFRKRHYEEIADALVKAKRLLKNRPYMNGDDTVELITRQLTDMFANDNALFEESRFVDRIDKALVISRIEG